jgi:hypothetical protein
MDNPHPADEFTNIRKLLERLETGYAIIRHNGQDVTKREIGILKHEIKHLEKVIARLKADA